MADEYDIDDEECKNCHHARRHHKRPGMCTGLGDEKGLLGSFCPCFQFVRKNTYRNHGTGYSTYVPSAAPAFNQFSSKREIGNGTGAPRPNLQYEHTSGGQGASPKWVMFGVQLADGRVAVFASTKLSYMKLRQEVGHFDDLHADMIRDGKLASTPWDISGRMVDYVRVVADTYGEAIARLFSTWKPDGEPTTEELQRRAAIEEARNAAEAAETTVRRDVEPDVHLETESDEDDIVDAELVEED